MSHCNTAKSIVLSLSSVDYYAPFGPCAPCRVHLVDTCRSLLLHVLYFTTPLCALFLFSFVVVKFCCYCYFEWLLLLTRNTLICSSHTHPLGPNDANYESLQCLPLKTLIHPSTGYFLRSRGCQHPCVTRDGKTGRVFDNRFLLDLARECNEKDTFH